MSKYYDIKKDEPFTLIITNVEMPDGSRQFIQIKLNEEGLSADFFEDGKITKSFTRTYTELSQESKCN